MSNWKLKKKKHNQSPIRWQPTSPIKVGPRDFQPNSTEVDGTVERGGKVVTPCFQTSPMSSRGDFGGSLVMQILEWKWNDNDIIYIYIRKWKDIVDIWCVEIVWPKDLLVLGKMVERFGLRVHMGWKMLRRQACGWNSWHRDLNNHEAVIFVMYEERCGYVYNSLFTSLCILLSTSL